MLEKSRFTFILILASGFLAAALQAEPISPFLVGNNLWWAERGKAETTPSEKAMAAVPGAGISLIRIGGRTFDDTMPSDKDLLTWVQRIRKTGAEPFIQVSRHVSPERAAATVVFLNGTSGQNVNWWSIGNEPWLQAKHSGKSPSEAEIASEVEAYFKPIATAMKGADPSIRIFGVESEDLQPGFHARLFGGENNIAGKVPGKDYYYCDGLTWHRYPQEKGKEPAYGGLADLRERITGTRAILDSANASQKRTGEDALLWGIGEFNSRTGQLVHSFANGQMFAGVYGLSMKYGATFAAAWSLNESGGNRGHTDFSLFDGTGMVPRPSYWHSSLIGKYFTGHYLEGTPAISSDDSSILVFGAEDPEKGRITVMILNRSTGEPRPYLLHLDNAPHPVDSGTTLIGVNASRTESFKGSIGPQSTHVLVFDLKDGGRTLISYTNDDFLQARPPQFSGDALADSEN